MLELLIMPFVAYGHAFAGIAESNGGNYILSILALVIWPVFVIIGICALIDSARS